MHKRFLRGENHFILPKNDSKWILISGPWFDWLEEHNSNRNFVEIATVDSFDGPIMTYHKQAWRFQRWHPGCHYIDSRKLPSVVAKRRMLFSIYTIWEEYQKRRYRHGWVLWPQGNVPTHLGNLDGFMMPQIL